MTDPLLILTGEVERVQRQPLFTEGVAEGVTDRSITDINWRDKNSSKTTIIY